MKQPLAIFPHMKRRYLTEWDRRHAWRVANRKTILAALLALVGAVGIALAIAADAPPGVILAPCLLTLAACVASGWFLAMRTLARP